MKLIHTIVTAAMLLASAAAFAQPSVSLSLTGTTIEKALDRIEDQSGYNFLIADKSLDLSKRVDVSADNKPLTQVLDQLFAGTNIAYRIEDRQIILSPRPAGAPSSESDTYNLRGTIIDSNGEPIVGAYIVNKNTGKGTMSDNNGGYSLDVTPDATVEISFLGFVTQNIELNGKQKLNVTLREDRETLDEVVVVGYGTQKRKDLTGSISSVSMNDEPVNSVNSVSHMLAGKAAGLYVSQAGNLVAGLMQGLILDVKFNADGTAEDISPLKNTIETIKGPELLTYYNSMSGNYVARFNHRAGYNISTNTGYYKMDFTANQGNFKDNRGIKELFSEIDDPRFIFTDRAYFVNLDYVQELDGSWLVLNNEDRVPISRPMMPNVKKAMIALWGGNKKK